MQVWSGLESLTSPGVIHLQPMLLRTSWGWSMDPFTSLHHLFSSPSLRHSFFGRQGLGPDLPPSSSPSRRHSFFGRQGLGPNLLITSSHLLHSATAFSDVRVLVHESLHFTSSSLLIFVTPPQLFRTSGSWSRSSSIVISFTPPQLFRTSGSWSNDSFTASLPPRLKVSSS